MRKITLLALFLLLVAPLLIAQCETGPVGGTDGACGGGGGGWYPETIQWGAYPYINVVSAYDVGKGYTYSYGNGYSMLDSQGFETNGVGIYPVSDHEAYLFVDGQYQLTLDTNNVGTFYIAREILLNSPICAMGCRFRRVTEDLWWALKTGASDACNRATGNVGWLAFAMFATMGDNLPAAVAMYPAYVQALEVQHQACTK